MERTRTIYYCDKCGKEISHKRTSANYVTDIWNQCRYDLCLKCREQFDKYFAAMKKLDDEMNELTEEGKWGKHMFKDDSDGVISFFDEFVFNKEIDWGKSELERIIKDGKQSNN